MSRGAGASHRLTQQRRSEFGSGPPAVWLKRVWRCAEPDWPQLPWTEAHELTHRGPDACIRLLNFAVAITGPQELVGRVDPLADLASALEHISHCDPRIVLVSGAAGIGKTTLVGVFPDA